MERCFKYPCGCREDWDTGEATFCQNPKHGKIWCGCYIIGGSRRRCKFHFWLKFVFMLPLIAVLFFILLVQKIRKVFRYYFFGS